MPPFTDPTGASETGGRLGGAQGTWAVTRRHGGRLWRGLQAEASSGGSATAWGDAVYVSFLSPAGQGGPTWRRPGAPSSWESAQRGATMSPASATHPGERAMSLHVDGGSAPLGSPWPSVAPLRRRAAPGEPRGVYYEGVCTRPAAAPSRQQIPTAPSAATAAGPPSRCGGLAAAACADACASRSPGSTGRSRLWAGGASSSAPRVALRDRRGHHNRRRRDRPPAGQQPADARNQRDGRQVTDPSHVWARRRKLGRRARARGGLVADLDEDCPVTTIRLGLESEGPKARWSCPVSSSRSSGWSVS